jgi:hypothetical protein
VLRQTTLVAYEPATGIVLFSLTLPSKYPTATPSIQFGAGAASVPLGNGVESFTAYPLEYVPPTVPDVPAVSTSENKVEMQWAPSTDSGSGMVNYLVYRADAATPTNWTHLVGFLSHSPNYADVTVASGSSYKYLIRAVDYHQNIADRVIDVAVPPAGAYDPRQIGLRPTGTYWGAGSEQIDLQSGNLNYTVPLLQAKGRTGWSVPISLNYNSQMWRKDAASNSTWYYGRDTGYGHGWRLLAGSIALFTKTGIRSRFGSIRIRREPSTGSIRTTAMSGLASWQGWRVRQLRSEQQPSSLQ